MNDELKKILETAQSKRKENKLFLKKAAQQKSTALDKKFKEETNVFFDKYSCLDCANCCKTTSPIFRDVDIGRIAQHLHIKPGELVEKYLRLDEDGHYVLRKSPCPFLLEDNYCSIYHIRPQACREYPHTIRKNMYQIMDLTYQNSLICPAVAAIVERLKKVT
ncbi:MAG: YkgJ family cysteine cluster protein [Bacteroidetes bacterium]|jgi:Fe-S-cluster containining protein|nr:YkgJ family cysteine cluster protein [Bacteroidota bacterium]